MDDNVCEMDEDSLFDYSIVQFIKRGRQSTTREMDIVPTKWLGFSKKNGRCTSKFPLASTNPEDSKLLHELVKVLAEAPEDWKEYTVDIKGRARTYNEAMKKFETLKVKENCLSGSDAEVLKVRMLEDVKRRQLQNELAKMEATLNVNSHAESVTGAKENIKGQMPGKSTSNTQSNADLNEALSPSYTNEGASASSSSIDFFEIFFNESTRFDTEEDNDLDMDPPSKKKTKKSEDSITFVDKVKDVEASLPSMDLLNIDLSDKIQYRSAVLSELRTIREELQLIRGAQEDASAYMLDKQIINTKKIDLYKKYKLTVPFNDKETFTQFNDKLKYNKYLQNDVSSLLQSCLDKDLVISKSFLQMLKFFMTKELAMGYTATRKSRDKENPKDQLQPLPFYKLMEIVTTAAREQKKLPITQKDSIACLSDVLCNVKNWDRKKN